MAKKSIFGIAIVVLFLVPLMAGSKTFIGAGPGLFAPTGDIQNRNKLAAGINLELESRYYCHWWFGLRFDYFNFTKKDDLYFGTDYYTNAFYLSPEVRWVVLGGQCYNWRVLPYFQGMLTMSSIGNTDNKNRMGLGAAFGLGVALGFDLFGYPCWMIDLNGHYSSPNAFARDKGRLVVNSLNSSLTLSVGF